MNVFLHLMVDCSEILCVGLSNLKNSILLSYFLYMVSIKSYFHVNADVEILCLNLNNLRIINCIKILATKSNFMGLKSLYTKFQIPVIKMSKDIHF